MACGNNLNRNPSARRPLVAKIHFALVFTDELLQQASDVGGSIFAVGIHDHDRAGQVALRQVNQPDTQGALMPEVGSQFHALDLLNVTWWIFWKLLRH